MWCWNLWFFFFFNSGNIFFHIRNSSLQEIPLGVFKCVFGGQRGEAANIGPPVHWVPESLWTAMGDGMRLAWGDRGSDSLPLCHTYLPDFFFLLKWGTASLLPLGNRLLFLCFSLSQLKKKKKKISQAALTRISCTGWLDPPKKIWKQDKIVKRFGETWDSSERWAPALAHGINILTNHSTQRKL